VHSVGGARAPVAMWRCQGDVAGVRGPGLRSLVSPADPPLVSARTPRARAKHAFPLTALTASRAPRPPLYRARDGLCQPGRGH
jgi:hypothetical protein